MKFGRQVIPMKVTSTPYFNPLLQQFQMDVQRSEVGAAHSPFGLAQ
jgi:hypothetical protein